MTLTLAACFGLEPHEDLSAYRPALVAQARHLGASADVAEDLAQDALVRYFERGHQLRDPAAVRAWLRRVLANLWADRHRREPLMVSLDDL